MTEDLNDLVCPHSAAGRPERLSAKACILAGECGCAYDAEWSRALRLADDAALWSSEDCATYLRISKSSFSQRIACLPGFHQAIRLPRADGRATHPRWKAREVIEWAERYQERRAA